MKTTRSLSHIVGLCLKGIAIGTFVGLGVAVLAIVVMVVIPLAMMVVTAGGAATGGGGIVGFSGGFVRFSSDFVAIPAAIGFALGFCWTIIRSPQSE